MKITSFETFSKYELKPDETYTLVYALPDSYVPLKTEPEKDQQEKRDRLQKLTTALINKVIDSAVFQFVSAKADFTAKNYSIKTKLKDKTDEKLGFAVAVVPLVMAGGALLAILSTYFTTRSFKPVKVIIDSVVNIIRFLPLLIVSGAVFALSVGTKDIVKTLRGDNL